MLFLKKQPATRYEITSQRIYLRPAQRRDCKQWLGIRRDSKDFLEPWEPAWPKDALSKQFFSRRMERLNREWKEGRSCSFLIFLRDDDRLIGAININNIHYGAARSGTLGYWLGHDYIGQGYMYEAGRAVIDFAFTDRGLHRLNAACIPDNGRSKNLLLKLGFDEEGYAKAYLKINGFWQDHILFGLNNPKDS